MVVWHIQVGQFPTFFDGHARQIPLEALWRSTGIVIMSRPLSAREVLKPLVTST